MGLDRFTLAVDSSPSWASISIRSEPKIAGSFAKVMSEGCRRFATVTLGLSVALFVLGLLLLVMGPLVAQMTAYSAYIEDYGPSSCYITSKSVITLGSSVDCKSSSYLAVWYPDSQFSLVGSPTSAKQSKADATAQLNDYALNTPYDCYCQIYTTTPVLVVDPLTCNVWPNCFLDINAVLEFKRVYRIHVVGQITWIVSIIMIALFVITLIVGCIVKRCSKRSSYAELNEMQPKPL